ncbi:MAG: hypothetical protein Q8L13_11775 [Bradyrhizobium sp.]|uniref:hypothetical protein n=1 Tax=Bradyrhizobium sp. TaxID=376 RepID=UPI002731BD05|nr:hypothetical protein [Bradyrhizobium sp.]MDP1867004.1 hypothetical protein [Bradyrhizobium sp.]
MTDQVVTQLTIASDTSGAAAYERAMASAEQAATGYNNAVAGIAAAAVAGLVGLKSLMDYVASANKQLADMNTMAKQVGLTLSDFQGVQFGGQIKGMTEAQINAGLEKSAALLNDAQRNANSLSKQFEANGVSIRNANGQLISQNQLLGAAADMIKRARDPGDQLAIAQMLGFTKEWIPLLEQGSGAMADLTDEARKAGAVIDDETIAKAVEFDREWRKSSVEMSAYMRAALVGLLPYVNDLINRMAEFLKTIDWAKVATHFEEGAGKLGDAAGIPNEAGIKIGITPEADKAMQEFKDASFFSVEKYAAAARILTAAVQSVDAISERDVKWYRGADAGTFAARFAGESALSVGQANSTKPVIDTSDAAMGSAKRTAAWIAEGAAWKNLSSQVLSGADAMAGGFTKVASKSEEVDDAVDRAINSLAKHIRAQQADADSMGLGARAHAEFRAQAAMTSAVQANGGEITADQAAEFEKLKKQAGDAAEALERAKVASQIDFARKTAFLSPQDVAIANQLRGIYGNDVPAALASTEAAAIRVNTAMRDISDGFRDVGKSMFTAFLSGKNVMDAMVQSLDNVARKLADSAFENILGGLASGNLVQAGIGGAQAGASALISMFTGDQKAKKELEQAKARWAAMADQVLDFNAAAAGFDLGPLTSELNSIRNTFESLRRAADEAQDAAGAARLNQTFMAGTIRIVDEFKAGAETLSPLQTAIKGVNDEYRGLYETLVSLNYGSLTIGLAEAAKAQIDKIIAEYSDQLNKSLDERLNTANGDGYLNDAAALMARRQQDLSDAAILGNDPAMLARISSVFQAEAQKIVNDAGLVGAEFADFTALFPEFAGVVTESADALAAASERFEAMTKTIDDYLNSLHLGDKSILNPQDQLDAAQAQFKAQLALAQAGNADAMGSITQYASALLDQAKGFYASSAGYGDVYNAVTDALRGLTGAGSSGMGAGGMTQPGLSGMVQTPSVMAPVSPTFSVAAGNDNGQHFASLGTQLVNAMAGVSMGEITAMREENAKLREMVALLIRTVESNKSGTPRPASKAA